MIIIIDYNSLKNSYQGYPVVNRYIFNIDLNELVNYVETMFLCSLFYR